MTKPKKRGKGIIVIAIGAIVLISILGGYVLFSEGSPFAPTYSLTVTVKDAYGAVEGATVDVAGDTYITDSTGSITPLTLAGDTYAIIVTAPEHGTKTQIIDLASDMDLIIELDYTHQYLTITSPTEGSFIDSSSAERDPSGIADIVIWVEGRYSPGREPAKYIKTFIDESIEFKTVAYGDVSTNWRIRVHIGRVPPGEHILYVQLIQGWAGGSVVEQQTVTINVPTEWSMAYSTVGLADSGESISRNLPESPAWLGMNPPFPGQVARIQGRFYFESLGNPIYEVWLDLYDTTTNSWVIAEKLMNPQSGWNDVDVGIDFITTDWWGFAGARYSNGVACNRVTEFDGEVWMVAGTHTDVAYTIFPDWFYDQFFPAGDEITSGPAPVISTDGSTIMAIDPSDLYAYAGSTPIAWIICIAISLIVFLGVAIFFMRRKGMI